MVYFNMHYTLCLAVLAALTLPAYSEILNSNMATEDFCAANPCGEGNTCFNTPIGYKCFCRVGDEREDCVKQETCMLYNHTGICRKDCFDDETGFFISHLGGRFMDLRIYNKDGNVTAEQHVPVGDIREQDPCMWQLTGKPNCCVPTKDAKIGCFAYGSRVSTAERGVIPIEEVRTGDKVQTLSANGDILYTDVIMIMHQEPNRQEDMVAITTSETGSKITLTHDHLAYVYSGGRWEYIFSERVLPGMQIKVLGAEGSRIEFVQTVERHTHRGLYAPVTMTGTIVVDSVLASCYGNHPDHYLSHMVFAPIRWAYNYMPWVYNGDAVTDDGSHPYVSFLNRHLRALTGYGLVLTQHRLDGITTYL